MSICQTTDRCRIFPLVTHHSLTQEGIIEASFEGDMEKAFRVFSHDLAIQKLPLSDARSLFSEMCSATGVAGK